MCQMPGLQHGVTGVHGSDAALAVYGFLLGGVGRPVGGL